MRSKNISQGAKSIKLVKSARRSQSLLKSSAFLQRIIVKLAYSDEFTQFKPIRMKYTQLFAESLHKCPQQIVAIVELFQYGDGKIKEGILYQDSDVITTQVSKARWGEGTWTVPMGKIEATDGLPNDSLNVAVYNAARREAFEEVIRTNTEDCFFIAGSFLDTATGYLIHVVIDEIGVRRKNEIILELALPNLREHSDVCWIKIRDIPRLAPMNAGSKFVFLTALKFIHKQNATLLKYFY